MDKRQKNNLMTTITLIVVLGQFILKTRKDETEYIKHRLVLKYDNGCISAEVIDMIIKDFYPNYINKIR